MSSLVIGKKEHLVAPDGAAQSAAELVLFEKRSGGIEVSSRIQRSVTEKLEGIPVKRVAPRLADNGDHAAVVVAVLGIEVAGESSELIDRIKVGNDRRASVHVLLYIDPVHHESVGRLALAID